MMRRIVLAAAAACGLAYLAACAGSGQAGSGENGTYSLINATYPACESQGRSLAEYLSTGNPAADNLNWGDERQQELSLSGAKQSLYVSQVADEYISQCDSNDAQAAQQAQAAVSASAAASAAAARWTQASQVCAKMGGHMAPAACMNVPYYSSDGQTYEYDLSVGSAGLKPNTATGWANVSATRLQCERVHGYWDYRLCLVDNPN